MRFFIRLITRIFLGLLAFILLIAASGFVYQQVAEARDQRSAQHPGQMVDAGGFDLYVQVMGEPAAGPAVILENGGGGIAPQWGWVQPEVAQFAQVVAYDRPGTGLSERPPEPLDAAGAAQALHTALERLGIEGPYVIAGHSMGGLMTRVFAKLYPEEVEGMVFVDPRDLTWEGVYTEEEARVPTEMYRVLQVLSHFGVTRVTGLASRQVEGLPEASYRQAVAVGSTPEYMAGIPDDARYGETAVEYLMQGENLQNTPMIVLSAGSADDAFNSTQRENFKNFTLRCRPGLLRANTASCREPDIFQSSWIVNTLPKLWTPSVNW